jgi:hypothetical protein
MGKKPKPTEKETTGEKTKRASKYVRPKKPEPMVLTDRDKEILTRIWEDRMLFTSQIGRIFFRGKTGANIRLRKLWENRYLDRYFLPTLMFHGSTEAIYMPGKKGVDIVAAMLGVERTEIARGMSYLKQKVRTHSFLLSLDHILAVADFRIAFAEAAEDHPDVSLEGWIPERMCEDSYRFWRAGEKVAGKLRPDGYCQCQYGEKRYSFFVEVDLGTMSGKAFEHKVQRYLDYSESGRYQQRFGVRYFRALVATTGTQRLINLKGTTEQLTESIFWFTTLDQVWRGKVFDRIWMRAGQEGIYPLL